MAAATPWLAGMLSVALYVLVFPDRERAVDVVLPAGGVTATLTPVRAAFDVTCALTFTCPPEDGRFRGATCGLLRDGPCCVELAPPASSRSRLAPSKGPHPVP